MTANAATISVDQFVAAPPAKVWRLLTEPELHARWWVPGDIAAIVGHRFHLQMPGWGAVACEVLDVEPEQRLVYTFNTEWTLTWRLVAEGSGTRATAPDHRPSLDLIAPAESHPSERVASPLVVEVEPDCFSITPGRRTDVVVVVQSIN